MESLLALSLDKRVGLSRALTRCSVPLLILLPNSRNPRARVGSSYDKAEVARPFWTIRQQYPLRYSKGGRRRHSMSSTTQRAEIEALFQQLVQAHADQRCGRHVEAYAPDAVLYDFAPPLGRRGMHRDSVTAWRASWEGPFRSMHVTSILPSLATWRASQRAPGCAGAKAGKTRTSGIARRGVCGRQAGDGASSAITRPCPATWMGALARRWIRNHRGARGTEVRHHSRASGVACSGRCSTGSRTTSCLTRF